MCDLSPKGRLSAASLGVSVPVLAFHVKSMLPTVAVWAVPMVRGPCSHCELVPTTVGASRSGTHPVGTVKPGPAFQALGSRAEQGRPGVRLEDLSCRQEVDRWGAQGSEGSG